MCCIQKSLVKLLKQSDLSEMPGKSEILMGNARKFIFIAVFSKEAFNVNFNAGIMHDTLITRYDGWALSLRVI